MGGSFVTVGSVAPARIGIRAIVAAAKPNDSFIRGGLSRVSIHHSDQTTANRFSTSGTCVEAARPGSGPAPGYLRILNAFQGQ